eukprot:2744658-Amphidinium_carterae.1
MQSPPPVQCQQQLENLPNHLSTKEKLAIVTDSQAATQPNCRNISSTRARKGRDLFTAITHRSESQTTVSDQSAKPSGSYTHTITMTMLDNPIPVPNSAKANLGTVHGMHKPQLN